MLVGVLTAMLLGITIKIIKNEDHTMDVVPAGTFDLFMVRIACSIAMHIFTYPEVKGAMIIMKYVVNHPENFYKYWIPFFIGYLQFQTAMFAEIVCVYLLSYQHTIEHCIVHFMALEIIVELPKVYFKSFSHDNNVTQVLDEHLIVTNKGSEMDFKKRDCLNKYLRILYKIFRGIYVSFVFYFIPFFVLAVQYYYHVDYVPH